ncbi:MAG: hypothetical protein ACT4QD_15195 [Acidobacteriota bacterium]
MTPLVEACVLPALFLTVAVAGALRPGAVQTFVAPSPASLIAATVLFAVLIKSGALAPGRLMHASRSPLANANGLSVLVTTFVASAQIVMVLVPESGVPALIGWVVMTSLLLQALVIGPDRQRVLRGLLVVFGVGFTLKFVILAAISQPAEGPLTRAMQLLFEGVTLGGVSQRATHPAEAYLAFLTIAVFLVGIAWLPPAAWRMVRRASPGELEDAASPRRLEP